MAADEVLAAAATAESAEVIRVTVTAHQEGGIQPYSLNPTQPLQRELVVQLAAWAAKSQQRDVIVPYDPGRKPDAHEVPVADTTEVPGLVELLQRIEENAPLGLLDRSVPANSLTSNIVSAGRGSDWVHGVRLKTTAVAIGKGIVATLAGNRYDLLDAPPLLFSATFDAIATTTEVLIFRQYQFEASFGFLEGVRAVAEETLRRGTRRLRIANFDELLAAVRDDRRMLAKLRSVKARLQDPAYLAALRMNRVVRLATTRPDLGIELIGPAGRERLVFRPDPRSRFTILKLFDDDYVRSLLTDLDYEANSKTRLT